MIINKDDIQRELDKFYYAIENIVDSDIENEMGSNIDSNARKLLQKLYNNLGETNELLIDLMGHFKSKQDKRVKKVEKALDHIDSMYDLLNPMAQDEDIELI